MNTTPIICPGCGELVIARSLDDGHTLLLPPHPDRIQPDTACTAVTHTAPASPRLR